jgi:hypothetical protein
VQGYAEAIKANQGSGAWGYDYQVGGIAAGLDLYRRPGSVLGIAFGLSQSDATHEVGTDKSRSTSYDLGLYAHAADGAAELNFSAFFSRASLNHTRQVDVGGVNKSVSGKPGTYRTGVALLHAALGAGVTNRSAYHEAGEDAAAMEFDPVSTPYFQLDLGIGYSYELFRGDKSWRAFAEAITSAVVTTPEDGRARFLAPSASAVDQTLELPSTTYLQVRPAVGVSWNKGSNFAELKLFTELRAGKSSPGASFSYRHQF